MLCIGTWTEGVLEVGELEVLTELLGEFEIPSELFVELEVLTELLGWLVVWSSWPVYYKIPILRQFVIVSNFKQWIKSTS